MTALRRGMIVVFALVLFGGLNEVMAQRGPGGGGMGLHGYGPRMGVNVELALEHQEELGLTPQQIASLQEMQAGIRENVAPLEEEIANLRSQIRDQEVDPEEGLPRLRELMEEYRTAAEPYRSGVTTILTVDQHVRLRAKVQANRAESRALARAGAGRGVGRGFVRGGRIGAGRGVGRGMVRGGRFQMRAPVRGIDRMRMPLFRNRIIRDGEGIEGPSAG